MKRVVLAIFAEVVVVATGIALGHVDQYDQTSSLRYGISGALVCLATVAVLTFSVNVTKTSDGKTKAIGVIVCIGCGLFTLLAATSAYYGISNHLAGRRAYDAAVQKCGHAPLLIETTFGEKFYILTTDSDYERLKYSVGEPKLIGPSGYLCSEATAVAEGYRHDPMP